MATKINVRSPYYLGAAANGLSYAVLKLYIYGNNLTTDKPATPQYTVKKFQINSNEACYFEISQLVRDYIEPDIVTSLGAYINTTEAMWVEADITMYNSSDSNIGTSNSDFIAFDGYGYFEEGVNPTLDVALMQSNNIIYRYINSEFYIPVYYNKVISVTFFNNGVELYKNTLSGGVNTSSNQVQYIFSNRLGGYGSFKQRVATDGGTFVDSICLQNIYKSYDLYDVDKVYVETTTGIEIYDVVNISECKYTPIKCDFINKFGVKQEIWFFKKSKTKLDVSKENYSSNILDVSISTFPDIPAITTIYSTTNHQSQDYNITAKESITLNTGFIDEQYSEVMRQLTLSEKVWLTIEDTILPVNVKTNSLDYKTKLNDRLINYTIDFEFAFNKINNIT